ncbi:MAG: hypothetical protein C0621_05045 [Desulfuromonas sp.]|nr:MAG: hypothetical protein C0621_05045 [Desulfuromonas sp.]
MTQIDLPPQKSVGHLTLLRQPKTLTPKQFNALPIEERLEIVRSASGRKKYDLLLETADTAALVSRLPVQELYLLVKELGREDAVELLPLLDAEQFTSFLDLEAWQGDRLDGAAMFDWIAALAEGGDELVAARLRQLDFDLLVVFFHTLLDVTGSPGEIEDEEVRAEAVRRNGGYEIVYRDEEKGKEVAVLLDLLFRLDNDLFRDLLEAVRWEAQSMLEEDVYQQRAVRLRELGFPDPFEARAAFARLEAAQLEAQSEKKKPLQPLQEVSSPTFFLNLVSGEGMLGELLARGLRPDSAWELTFLVNKVLLAQGGDPGSLDAVRHAAQTVYGGVNLALEVLGADDFARIETLFADCYSEHLFRVGHTLTLELCRRAQALNMSPLAPYLEGEFLTLVRALDRSRPLFPLFFDDPRRAGERPFASRHDLQRAEAMLTRIEGMGALFAALPFFLPDPADVDLAGCQPAAEELGLSHFILTALANQLLGRSFLPLPLPSEELVLLHRTISHDGSLLEEVRRSCCETLESFWAGAGECVDWALDLLHDGFCALAEKEIDPRYVEGLIVRLKS